MANFMEKIRMPLNQHQEPTEIERVQQNMLQVEMEIQQKFTQLGTMLYRDNIENSQLGDKYKELIESINKLDQNRKGYYAHKLRLEGNMMCVNCGAIIPYGSVYCAKCGKKADEKQEGKDAGGPEIKRCAKCGEPVTDESQFCTSCGAKLE